MGSNYERGLYKEYEVLVTKKEATEEKFRLLKIQYELIENELRRVAAREQKLKEELKEKEEENEALKKEILRLNGYINADGTNSGIPTSKTPIQKKKVIPNTRKKSGKKIGGQNGHPKAKLEAFEDKEITQTQEHELEACPSCGGEIEKTEKTIEKDELDYEIVVIKKRHKFNIYKCKECKKEIHASIPVKLKEENQYGSHVKALGLVLMNIGNVSVNKVRKMIYGLSETQINPSEGYLIKQQEKAAEELKIFIEELRKRCIEQPIVYWDDTVIDINGKRGCLRYYGDERLALYKAHRYKNKEGIDKDKILNVLPAQTVVMHDHNKINYNNSYSFSNIECNVHLLRDLQKTADNLQHKWPMELKELLEKTNKERNEAMEKAEKAFDNAYIEKFFEKFNNIMISAVEENTEDFNQYYGQEERTLILRILEYKDNYLAWVVNFDFPFSNNLSERSLRGVKSKMKISGQFQNEKAAENYAAVKSYIETCYRNGINETEALVRLCDGHPYTVVEVFAHNSDV